MEVGGCRSSGEDVGRPPEIWLGTQEDSSVDEREEDFLEVDLDSEVGENFFEVDSRRIIQTRGGVLTSRRIDTCHTNPLEDPTEAEQQLPHTDTYISHSYKPVSQMRF